MRTRGPRTDFFPFGPKAKRKGYATRLGMGRRMGASVGLWRRRALAALDPFAKFEEGLQVPLDHIVPGPHAAPLASFFLAQGVPLADPTAPTDWGWPAQRALEDPRMRPGARLALGDAHGFQLGALGLTTFHHAPAALLARTREKYEPLSQPRLVRLHVNDSAPAGTDALDLAFHALASAGPAELVGAVLEVDGDGYRRLDLAGRRRFLGALGAAAPLTVLAPVDATAAAYWRVLGLDADEEAEAGLDGHDELLIVNASDADPAIRPPVQVAPMRIADLGPQPVGRVLVGGCLGGELDTLRRVVDHLSADPPRPGVEVHLVPGSARVHELARLEGLADRAESVGVHLTPPSRLPASDAPTLATSPCLAPGATWAAPPVLIESARNGALALPRGAL